MKAVRNFLIERPFIFDLISKTLTSSSCQFQKLNQYKKEGKLALKHMFFVVAVSYTIDEPPRRYRCYYQILSEFILK